MAMKFLKIFALLFLFMASLILFLPKKNLYYYAEKQLENYKVVIDNEEAKQIRLSGMAKNFLPTRVEWLRVHYNLWNPLKVHFEASGEFGKAHGVFLLQEQKVFVTLQPSKMMQSRYANILRRMKREKSGEYSYAQRF